MKARDNCTADVLRPSAIGLFHEVACIDVDMFRFRTHLQFFFLRARVYRQIQGRHEIVQSGFPLAVRAYIDLVGTRRFTAPLFPLARAHVYRPMTVNRDRILSRPRRTSRLYIFGLSFVSAYLLLLNRLISIPKSSEKFIF